MTGGKGDDRMEMVVHATDSAPLRLALNGRLDAAGTEKVETKFFATIGGATSDVLVDMSGVAFVGSLGIRMLIAAARQATRSRRRLVLFGVQPAVSEVFSTVALDDLIPIVADEAAALAHLAA